MLIFTPGIDYIISEANLLRVRFFLIQSMPRRSSKKMQHLLVLIDRWENKRVIKAKIKKKSLFLLKTTSYFKLNWSWNSLTDVTTTKIERNDFWIEWCCSNLTTIRIRCLTVGRPTYERESYPIRKLHPPRRPVINLTHRARFDTNPEANIIWEHDIANENNTPVLMIDSNSGGCQGVQGADPFVSGNESPL